MTAVALTPRTPTPRAKCSNPYQEKCSLKPFGPVDNGDQHLYGLDYKTAMWRADESDPFHTEVGYWLWDGATGEIVRAVVVPRGITELAGGVADGNAREFTLRAANGEAVESIPGFECQLAELRSDHLCHRSGLVLPRDHHVAYERIR